MKTITLTIEVGPNDTDDDVMVIFDLAKIVLKRRMTGIIYNRDETSRGHLEVKET